MPKSVEYHAKRLRSAKTLATARKHMNSLKEIGTKEAMRTIVDKGLAHDDTKVIIETAKRASDSKDGHVLWWLRHWRHLCQQRKINDPVPTIEEAIIKVTKNVARADAKKKLTPHKASITRIRELGEKIDHLKMFAEDSKAMDELIHIGTPQSIKTLLERAFENNSNGVHSLAYVKLWETLGGNAIPYFGRYGLRSEHTKNRGYWPAKAGLDALNYAAMRCAEPKKLINTLSKYGITHKDEVIHNISFRILTDIADDGHQKAVATSIIKHGLKHKTEAVQIESIEALQKIGGEKAIDALIKIAIKMPKQNKANEVIKTKDYEISKKAADALGVLRDKKALKPLVQHCLGTWIPDFDTVVMGSILKIGGEEAEKVLLKYGLKHPHVRAVEKSAILLGQLGSKDSLVPLMKLAGTLPLRIGNHATEAVRQIQKRLKSKK